MAARKLILRLRRMAGKKRQSLEILLIIITPLK
jgi:hypothetical protein